MRNLKFSQVTVITDADSGEELFREEKNNCYKEAVKVNRKGTAPYLSLVPIDCPSSEPPNPGGDGEQGGGNENGNEPLGNLTLNYEFELDGNCDYTNRSPNLRVGNAIPISNANGNGLEYTPDGRYTGILSAVATENTLDTEGLTGSKEIVRTDDPNAYVVVVMSPKRFVNQYDPNALDGRTPVGNGNYRPVIVYENDVVANDWTYIEEGNNVTYFKKFSNTIPELPNIKFSL